MRFYTANILATFNDGIDESLFYGLISMSVSIGATVHYSQNNSALATAGKKASGESPDNNTQQLKAEIAAIAGRCTIPEKSFRYYYISVSDYERLLQLSAV